MMTKNEIQKKIVGGGKKYIGTQYIEWTWGKEKSRILRTRTGNGKKEIKTRKINYIRCSNVHAAVHIISISKMRDCMSGQNENGNWCKDINLLQSHP